MKRIFRSLWILHTVLILGFIGCERARDYETIVPDTLGELKLSQRISGEAAQKMIDHMHGKGVTPEKNEIMFFDGASGKATVYVSTYADDAEAARTRERMAQRIRDGNPVFGHYQEEVIHGKRVSLCVGMGQAHFFFSEGRRLFWLGVDFQIAEQTLDHLLQAIRI